MVLKTYDHSFLDFLRRCLVWDPSLRMTPDQALKHAWIHEPRSFKHRPRSQTLRKPSLSHPLEGKKTKVHGHHHLSMKEEIAKESEGKLKDGSTLKPVQNAGDQQDSLQQEAAVVQLPHLAEAPAKSEAVAAAEQPSNSAGDQSKGPSPRNTNILPPIV